VSFILWLLGMVMAFVLVDGYTSDLDFMDIIMIVFWPVFVVIAIGQELFDRGR
jgi:hypothetical protein